MTEDEAIERMNAHCDSNDPECAHILADEILTQFLTANGFKKLADKFNEEARHFWYA